ncbi:MAG TPA: type II secretion system F family protein [Candidatus Limnocylindrales bacterium]|nr:type II secretion system F family protein [Candidatus Limnocylindrales bacterium]
MDTNDKEFSNPVETRTPSQTKTELVSEVVVPPTQISREKVSVKSVATFSRQLSTLVDVGIPLLKSLKLLEPRTSDPVLQRVINQIAQDIEIGNSFSEALAKHPRVFSKLFVNMIKVAEKGGSLERSLKIIADAIEKEDNIKRKIKNALRYPVITLIAAFLVVLVLFAGVIPIFRDLFQAQGMELPLPTRILIGVSNLIVGYWWLWFGLIVVLVIFHLLYRRTLSGRRFYDRLKMNLPIFGPLYRKMLVARFVQTFGTLIRGGVPLVQALQVVKDTSENLVVAEAIEKVSEHVEMGGRLEEPLRKTRVFPDLVVDMIATGEEAGKLEAMLFKVSDLYDAEIESTINTLSSTIEPVLIVVMGILTAIVALAMFAPYFKLVQTLGQ